MSRTFKSRIGRRGWTSGGHRYRRKYRLLRPPVDRFAPVAEPPRAVCEVEADEVLADLLEERGHLRLAHELRHVY